MTRLYGVFSPRGKLVAAFSSYKAADAMARYNWKAAGEALYWSIAPQPPTIKWIDVELEPPSDPHKLTEDPITTCSCFECPRHPVERQRAEWVRENDR